MDRGPWNLILVTLVLLYTVQSIAIALLPNVTTSPPGTFQFKAGFGVCDPPDNIINTGPKVSDCLDLIQKRLPNYRGMATFHTGGPEDIFILPGYWTWGGCNITVVIGGKGVRTEMSSWLDIRVAATEVVEICRNGDRTGGKSIVGMKDRIWIKVGQKLSGGQLSIA